METLQLLQSHFLLGYALYDLQSSENAKESSGGNRILRSAAGTAGEDGQAVFGFAEEAMPTPAAAEVEVELGTSEARERAEEGGGGVEEQLSAALRAMNAAIDGVDALPITLLRELSYRWTLWLSGVACRSVLTNNDFVAIVMSPSMCSILRYSERLDCGELSWMGIRLLLG